MSDLRPDNSEEKPQYPAPGDSEDLFAPYRQRVRRSFWMMGLQAVEAGDILPPEHLGRLYELLPEDGMTLHVADARGELALLASIPEEQLDSFAAEEWGVGHQIERSGTEPLLHLLLVVGERDPIQCPFVFDLADPQHLQEAIQLVEREEVRFFGVTHVEEGLMLTLVGLAPLPAAFREEIRRDLLSVLAAGQSHGST